MLTVEKEQLEISQDWLVQENGNCIALDVAELEIPETPYRMYRFLTEVEDILAAEPDDGRRIEAIAPLVRKLLNSSYWLQFEFVQPKPNPGWSVRFLYQDHQFPLTVQMVAWLPGQPSPIHNHGTWGIVAIVNGQEKNRFWRKAPTSEHPDRIELVGDRTLSPGDLISFLPNAIHSVEPLGDESAITFNIYGVTDFKQRFEFDAKNHTAKLF
ncbi:cupin [Vacuolonema iberomarrocanum]|uniref:cupin n=1 Tax=Vacuolonema iberomarrocanum TaxID=3454632 RepID=UPI001A0BE81F|nr:cupin [filamentous cyanobacterium LEGE 07170]